MTDLVNHPSHYKTESGLEVIDMIEQGLEKYDHRDQVLKYVYRAPSKGNFLQDLQKAQWYLNRTVQNVIDGKLKINELNYSKIAIPVPKISEEEKEPEPEFDKDFIYTDSDGDDWGWVPEFGTWAWGNTSQTRQGLAREYANLGRVYANPNHLFAPYTKKVDAPKYNQDMVFKDKDGDAWECIEGAWVTGDTHEERVASGHEMLEIGDYYTDLPNDYAPYTEFVAPAVFDESKRYLDGDGDIWGFYDGFWYFGSNNQDLEDKFGAIAYQWNRPCVRIENCTVVETPKYDTQKLYKDRDGDVWEHLSGHWVFGYDHDYRVEKRARGYGNLNLNEEFAPFEEIKDKIGETV